MKKIKAFFDHKTGKTESKEAREAREEKENNELNTSKVCNCKVYDCLTVLCVLPNYNHTATIVFLRLNQGGLAIIRRQ